MKKSQFFIFLALGLVTTVGAFAGVTNSVGTWKGSGTSFGRDGKPAARFLLQVVTEANGEHEVLSKITVTSGGKSRTFQQVLNDLEGGGFRLTSDNGNGGGHCFGQGLCEAYLGTKEHGFAVTIVLDNPDRRRTLITEIENGRAVRFIRESVERAE